MFNKKKKNITKIKESDMPLDIENLGAVDIFYWDNSKTMEISDKEATEMLEMDITFLRPFIRKPDFVSMAVEKMNYTAWEHDVKDPSKILNLPKKLIQDEETAFMVASEFHLPLNGNVTMEGYLEGRAGKVPCGWEHYVEPELLDRIYEMMSVLHRYIAGEIKLEDIDESFLTNKMFCVKLVQATEMCTYADYDEKYKGKEDKMSPAKIDKVLEKYIKKYHNTVDTIVDLHKNAVENEAGNNL